MGSTPLEHGRHAAEVRRKENARKAAKLMVSGLGFVWFGFRWCCCRRRRRIIRSSRSRSSSRRRSSGRS